MKIEVHLHATLRINRSGEVWKPIDIDLPNGSSIRDILDHLAIEVDPEHLLLVLNGRTTDLDQILKHGDVLNLMTAVSGG
jgi:sulfur carrier protein ThiS